MIFDPEKIVSLIVEQRTAIVRLLEVHDRALLLPPRLVKLCRSGSEAGVVQLAFLDDCLHAIESVLFSLNGARAIDLKSMFRFLQPVARVYAKKDTALYSRFREIKQAEVEVFLETHYTDCGAFGGANRRTKWSGFQLAKNTERLSSSGSCMVRYGEMLQRVVVPLLDENERFADVIELGGLWSAIQGSEKEPGQFVTLGSDSALLANFESHPFIVADFGNPSVLFDVITGPGCSPVVKVNSSHHAFQNSRTLELLLRAWAEMESNAWDRRKQLIGDIRSDWGRVARDLIAKAEATVLE